MEQIRYNMLFRWFVGLTLDDEVWVPTVFTKNRERLLEHDVAVALFNEIVVDADRRDLLSGEHFSVDGTLIRAWAGHKSFVRQDRDDDDDGNGDFRGEKRGSETHASRTDPDARLFRKGRITTSRLCYMGHTLSDNRHGLIVNARVTQAHRRTGSGQGHDPRRCSGRTAGRLGDPGCGQGLRCRRIRGHTPDHEGGSTCGQEHRPSTLGGARCGSGHRGLRRLDSQAQVDRTGLWRAKQIGALRQVMVRGLAKVDQRLLLTMTAYNLVRLRRLERLRATRSLRPSTG